MLYYAAAMKGREQKMALPFRRKEEAPHGHWAHKRGSHSWLIAGRLRLEVLARNSTTKFESRL
jgi:hypothetical protein